nr:DUF742 domain-containing protein [Kitasatospora purpeofusca]
MTADGQQPWVLQTRAGVRPFVVTGGRTRPTRALDLASLVKASAAGASTALDAEHHRAFTLSRHGPVSVAELAARLGQPVQITKVLVSDLIDQGALVPAMPHVTADPTDVNILEALLAGLQRL